jgi:hypothetical protein
MVKRPAGTTIPRHQGHRRTHGGIGRDTERAGGDSGQRVDRSGPQGGKLPPRKSPELGAVLVTEKWGPHAALGACLAVVSVARVPLEAHRVFNQYYGPGAQSPLQESPFRSDCRLPQCLCPHEMTKPPPPPPPTHPPHSAAGLVALPQNRMKNGRTAVSVAATCLYRPPLRFRLLQQITSFATTTYIYVLLRVQSRNASATTVAASG